MYINEKILALRLADLRLESLSLVCRAAAVTEVDPRSHGSCTTPESVRVTLFVRRGGAKRAEAKDLSTTKTTNMTKKTIIIIIIIVLFRPEA